MNEAAQDVIFDFGGFALDPRRQTLHRRSDGQPLDLTPRVFATLQHLVAHAGQLVDKRALLAAVWPKAVVEESSLTQAIHVLRRALGEQPDDHRFIVTVPGRGYRFVADVTTRPRPEAETAGGAAGAERPADRWRHARLVAGLVAVLAALVVALSARDAVPRPGERAVQAHPSIAVLPFVDLSPTRDFAYFSDGLAEEVLNLLAQAPDLTVIARTSSFSFRDRNVDIATIARKLQVGYVLEGSVRRDGRRARITAQLIEADGSSRLWSATFDRELDNVLAVQEEIAVAVASALQAKLAVRARTAAAAPRNAQAYDDFLRGRFFFTRRGPGDLERALHYFERAVGSDPEYARAWAGVAGVHWVLTAEGLMRLETGLPRIRDAAQRAIALDPHLAEGHVRLANYYRLAREDRLAREHFAHAATLDASNPLVLAMQAGRAAAEGRLDQAIELQRRVAAADPLSALVVNNLGHMLFSARRLDEAKAELLKSLELSPTSAAAGTVAQILVLQGEFNAARELIEQSTQGPDREQGLALVHHALGKTGEADAALARLAALSAAEDPFRLAEVHAYRGEVEESFKWLELASRPIDPQGMLLPGARQLWEIRASPLLYPLHADPRWQTWAAGSG